MYLEQIKEVRRESLAGSPLANQLCANQLVANNEDVATPGPEKGDRHGSKMNLSREQKMVQRKWSKNTTLRNAARTMTVGTEGASPRAPWDKFLRYFDHLELEFIYEQFDAVDYQSKSIISVEDALTILEGWNNANHDLQTVKPGEDALQEVLSNLGNGIPVTHLNFDLLVKFLRLCEAKVLQADPKAGFKPAAIKFLENAFEIHSKDRVLRNPDGTMTDVTRRSLNTADVFNVLQDMGRDTSEVNLQLPVVEIIKEMDVDSSGDLDFEEFLQFARRVRRMDDEEQRELERSLVCNCGLPYAEIDGFLQVFQKYDELQEGVFQVYRFAEIVESNSRRELDKQAKADLRAQIIEFGCLEDDDDAVTFGQFLGIIKQMLDNDVSGLMTSMHQVEAQMVDDKRFLAPEEYESKYAFHFGKSKTQWLIRKLQDNKVDQNELKASKKKASKEKFLRAMGA